MVTKETVPPIEGFATLYAQFEGLIVLFLKTDVCLVLQSSGEGEYRFVDCAIIPIAGEPFDRSKCTERGNAY